MCFSAKASFIAAGALSIIGLLSLKKASGVPKLLPFAAIPFIFSLQQITEGFVWLALSSGADQTISAYMFIFFAGVWWPVWTPTVLYLIEPRSRQQKWLIVTAVIGVITASLYVISLITQPVSVTIIHHHLYYPTLSYPFSSNSLWAQYVEFAVPVLYLSATVIPCFMSSIRWMWCVGITMGFAHLTSLFFFFPTTESVWCFFAALASAIVYVIVRNSINRNASF